MRSLVPLFGFVIGCSSPFSARAEETDHVATSSDAGQGNEPQSEAGAPSDPGPTGSGGQTTLVEGSSGRPDSVAGGPNEAPSSGSGGMPAIGGMGGTPPAGMGGVGGVPTEHTFGGMGGQNTVPIGGTGGAPMAGTGGSAGATAAAGAAGSPPNEPQCVVRRVLALDPAKRDDCLIYNVPGCAEVFRLSLPPNSTYQIQATSVPKDGCDMSESLPACLSGSVGDDEKHPILFSFKSKLLGEVRVFDGLTNACTDGGSEPCILCNRNVTSAFVGTLTPDDVELYSFDMQNGGVTTPKTP